MQTQKRKTYLAIVIAILTINSVSAQFSREALKYGQFISILENYYVDTINTSTLVEDAIKFHLKNLDPHSIYISKKDVDEMNEPLRGNFEGIGISFNVLNDTLFVIAPIPGGPSEKVGILAGDRIVHVEGKNIAGTGLTNEQVFSLLRGNKGTKVTISVLRRHVAELLDFNIVRDKIPLNSLDASYMVDDAIGYIKLTRFSLTTMDEFFKAANDLKNKGAENLILDLTGNSGGYLDVAAQLADQFLDDKKLIVYTQGLNSPRKDFLATSEGFYNKGKIIILIDEGSASASEIVSGAIQDWDRGLLIGRRSFGKGLVQRQMDLPDGSMIRLTVAQYYTPCGRLIQKPYGKDHDDYEEEIYSRYKKGEFTSKDSIHFPDSLKYKTLIGKREVFGGGGIMPDIFIPIDTLEYSDYYRDLIRKGILNQFILEFVDSNRDRLKKTYAEFKIYNEKFTIDDVMLGELVNFAAKKELPLNKEELERSKIKIGITLKAYIARDLWTTNEFYQVVNADSPNYKKAVEVMKNWDSNSKKLLK